MAIQQRADSHMAPEGRVFGKVKKSRMGTDTRAVEKEFRVWVNPRQGAQLRGEHSLNIMASFYRAKHFFISQE